MLSALLLLQCTEHPYVDAAMLGAYRPAHGRASSNAITAGTRYTLLAGDLHVHVSPPDVSWHAVRNVRQTLALARREGLDFFVFTPHIGARFFDDDASREDFLRSQRVLRAQIADAPSEGALAVAGFEYTDHEYGHVGASFADVERVLEDVSSQRAREQPALFFERYVARGGVLIVNHPLVSPMESFVPIARADLSWRAWTQPSGSLPAEVSAVHRLAHGFEAFNLTASRLRDGVLLGDETRGVRATMRRVDQEILSARRRIVPVGGSDSHSFHLRATTFVLAESRTEAALRDAIVGGRVCVRSPEACSLRVSVGDGRWRTVGDSLRATGSVSVRVLGSDAEVLLDGRVIARPASGQVSRVSVSDGCSLLRARVGDGYSAPVYINCEFAD